MKDLIFKEATTDDFDKLWSLIEESIEGQETNLSRQSLHEDLFGRRKLAIDAKIDEPSIELDLTQIQPSVPFCQALLAWKDCELVGYLMFHQFYSPWKGRKACIDYIYVRPNYRGMGVASGLTRRLMEFCKSESFSFLVYDVSRVNNELRNTLARYGSKVYRDDDTDWSVFRINL